MPTGRPTSKPRTDFGQRLFAAREARGLSQTQVAEKLGITQSSYADWERYTVALRPEQLALLAEVLEVTVEDLLGTKPKNRRGTGPAGKMRQLFEAATVLPRTQQQKIVDILEPFVSRHANGTNGH